MLEKSKLSINLSYQETFRTDKIFDFEYIESITRNKI